MIPLRFVSPLSPNNQPYNQPYEQNKNDVMSLVPPIGQYQQANVKISYQNQANTQPNINQYLQPNNQNIDTPISLIGKYQKDLLINIDDRQNQTTSATSLQNTQHPTPLNQQFQQLNIPQKI